jgi:hypothetical protein
MSICNLQFEKKTARFSSYRKYHSAIVQIISLDLYALLKVSILNIVLKMAIYSGFSHLKW